MNCKCECKRSKYDINLSFPRSIFCGLFYKRNRKHFPCVPICYRNTVELWENLKWHGNTRPVAGLVFPLQFLVLSNFHSCFLTVWNMANVFYFLNTTSYYFIYIYNFIYIKRDLTTNRHRAFGYMYEKHEKFIIDWIAILDVVTF